MTTDELQRAAEEVAGPDSWADPEKRALWLGRVVHIAEVLRPEGSVLIGGTCARCEHRCGEHLYISGGRREVLLCNNGDGPCAGSRVQPDFTCSDFLSSLSPRKDGPE